MLNTPIVYHDPEQELLFTYVPPELGLPEMEQQKLIGDLTNAVMSALPAEQRKGYLLRPRSFLRLEGMIDAILEADGITPEMLDAQRSRAALLDRLLRATGQDARQVIVQENQDKIDYEFFQLLALNLELAESEGQEQIAQHLLDLRQQLLEWTATGQEIADREEAIRSLGREVTREGLLEKLVAAALAADEAKIETLVAVARPAIDYVFYQQLTEQIEAAEREGKAEQATTLKRPARDHPRPDRRDRCRDGRSDPRTPPGSCKNWSTATSPRRVLRANADRLDELFLSVLARELDAAERTGKTERAEALQRVSNTLLEMIEESQPPQIRLINRLLTADYPQGTQALLEANRAQVNDDLLTLMDLIHEDLVQSSRDELAERLVKVREQASAMR